MPGELIRYSLNETFTRNGTHIFNYSCEKCFNISECPLPITIYHSNYQVNWIFLAIMLAVIVFLMWRFWDNIWKALGFTMGAVVLLSIIGGVFHLMSGLLMVIIIIVLAVVSLLRYREELGI